MKFSNQIIIDADPRTVWQTVDEKVPNIDTVTERREPHFLAGVCESSMGTTLIVNHFEAVDDSQTRWAMYANHSFKGIYRILGLFVANSIRKRNEDVMSKVKLVVETEQAQHEP